MLQTLEIRTKEKDMLNQLIWNSVVVDPASSNEQQSIPSQLHSG